jgi:hypothetical protein
MQPVTKKGETMKTYTVEFRTDGDYATHEFKAHSPQGALASR